MTEEEKKLHYQEHPELKRLKELMGEASGGPGRQTTGQGDQPSRDDFEKSKEEYRRLMGKFLESKRAMHGPPKLGKYGQPINPIFGSDIIEEGPEGERPRRTTGYHPYKRASDQPSFENARKLEAYYDQVRKAGMEPSPEGLIPRRSASEIEAGPEHMREKDEWRLRQMQSMHESARSSRQPQEMKQQEKVPSRPGYTPEPMKIPKANKPPMAWGIRNDTYKDGE